MRHATIGKIHILGAQPNHEAEGGSILHCLHHHTYVRKRHIRLAKSDASGIT